MRLIERKKGNNVYYYLQHSFRKENKVITKEKYSGKNPPRNIQNAEKQFLEELREASLFTRFEQIKQSFQKEWKKYPESIKEKVKKQIAIAFTYNTNAIEGSTITLAETRELIEQGIAPNKPLRDVKETEAHVTVFLDILEKEDSLCVDLILRWHKELFQQTKSDIAGKFRDYLVRVSNYVALDWQEVKPQMEALIKFYKENKTMNPVELASAMHYKFEKIHPFGDGNGRVGRILMNYILWHSKYPMLIIEYKKRRSYYRALQKQEGGFFNYFARRYLSVHKKYLSA